MTCSFSDPGAPPVSETNPLSKWAGLEVRTSQFHTVTVSRLVRRDWRERWLSRPWRPWRLSKWVMTHEPSPHVYQFGNVLSMHPATYRNLKASLEAQ